MNQSSTQNAKKNYKAKVQAGTLRENRVPYRSSMTELKKEFAVWDKLSDEALSNTEKALGC